MCQTILFKNLTPSEKSVMATVECDGCGKEFEDDEYCTYCDEVTPPQNSECEFCDNLATSYVQDHPVCNDCYDSAYSID